MDFDMKWASAVAELRERTWVGVSRIRRFTMGLLAAALLGHVRDADAAIVTLNRQVKEAITAGRRTDGLLAEIRAISENRNFLLARLRRLSSAETQACGPSKPETACPLEKSL